MFCFSVDEFSYFAAGRAFFNPFKFRGHSMVLIKLHFFVFSFSRAYFSETGVFFSTFGFSNNYWAEGLELGFTFRHALIIEKS